MTKNPGLPNVPVNALEIAAILKPGTTWKSLGDNFLVWPADLFALTSSILSATEVYRFLVSPPPGAKDATWPLAGGKLPNYLREVQGAARNWRKALSKNIRPNRELNPQTAYRAVPKVVKHHWRLLLAGMTTKPYFDDVRDILQATSNWDSICSLFTLHAIADETFSEFDPIAPTDHFDFFSSELFLATKSLSLIHPQRGRVLPKQHTPRVGLSLRSLSSALAFHRSPIDVVWRINPRATANSPASTQRINCLLLPWPLKIRTKDFRRAKPKAIKLADRYGFFTYDPQPDDLRGSLQDYLRKTLLAASQEVEHIDMVVLPESALRRTSTENSELAILRSELEMHGVDLFITGFCNSANGQSSFGQNGVLVGELEGNHKGKPSYTRTEEVIQHKHHRWILDREQVRAYQLGSILAPGITWIESTEIRERRVTILNSFGITICPLICEDLARQDPVADFVRTIGPTFIVAILMDGPQFVDRWASKYASVLADDPGCAVLTLSSAGMVRRWRGRGDRKGGDVIALWKDSEGPATEISLSADGHGVVLSLCIEHRKKICADGRESHRAVPHLSLFGVQEV